MEGELVGFLVRRGREDFVKESRSVSEEFWVVIRVEAEDCNEKIDWLSREVNGVVAMDASLGGEDEGMGTRGEESGV
jgi:hypothetical protein